MKKIIYIFTLITVFVLSSCSDFLTETNKSNPEANTFYKTASGYESLINSCYSTLRDVYGDNVEMFVAGTDLYKIGRAGLISQGLGSYQNLTPADNSVKAFYNVVYQSVRRCNEAIYYGETYKQNPIRIAEARFLRAFYYFHLVQQFGDVSLVKDHLIAPITGYPRTPASEVYTFIIEEMKVALSVLPPTAANRVNKRVVNHYLSLVYLTRAYETFGATTDFQSAVDYATTTINNQALSLPFDGKTGVFYPGNEKNAEIIFSVQYSPTSLASVTTGNSQASYFGSYLGGSDGAVNDGMPYMNSRLKPTMQLYKLLSVDASDKRFAGTFMQELYGVVSTGKCSFYSYFKKYDTRSDLEVLMYYPRPGAVQADVDAWKAINVSKRSSTIIKWATTGTVKNWEKNDLDKDFPCIKKFSDPDAPFNTTGSRRDIFLARLAETYLIRAEAYVKLGTKQTEAKNDINVVRTRAGAPLITEVSATIDYILDERAREFAGEYNRWYDLKRTGKLVQYVSTYNPDVPNESNMKGKDGKYKILRPIPQDAIGLNSTPITQNPGY
jgi:starch-binding outer membrane protein, SusD/RagB family